MKFVVFDIDGTLTNTKAVDDLCFTRAVRMIFDINISSENWDEYQNVTDSGILRQIIFNKFNRLPSELEIKQMRETFVRLLKTQYLKNVNLFLEIPGANSFLSALNGDNGMAYGFATGGWRSSALFKLSKAGIDTKGMPLTTASDFISREDILKNTIAKLTDLYGEPSSEVIYFGDGVWDYKTCKRIGIRFIAIDYHQDGILSKMGAKFVFKDYHDIVKLKQALNF